MKTLNVSLIKKLVLKEIESLKSVPTEQSLWDTKICEDLLKDLDAFKTMNEFALHNEGGSQLGVMRNWIQYKCLNGESVTWGSNEYLKFKDITVSDMEHLASHIASSKIREIFGAR